MEVGEDVADRFAESDGSLLHCLTRKALRVSQVCGERLSLDIFFDQAYAVLVFSDSTHKGQLGVTQRAQKLKLPAGSLLGIAAFEDLLDHPEVVQAVVTHQIDSRVSAFMDRLEY